MEDEVVLHIREDNTIQVEIREKGTVRTKLVDIDALLDCLTESMGGIQIQTGVLPNNKWFRSAGSLRSGRVHGLSSHRRKDNTGW